MPTRRRCTLRHIRDVLSGKKKYLHKFEIKHIDIPKFKEITVLSVYEKIKDNEEIMAYIPAWDGDKYDASVMLDREWFFDLLNTLDPDFFPKIIEELEHLRRKEA